MEVLAMLCLSESYNTDAVSLLVLHFEHCCGLRQCLEILALNKMLAENTQSFGKYCMEFYVNALLELYKL